MQGAIRIPMPASKEIKTAPPGKSKEINSLKARYEEWVFAQIGKSVRF